jgi:hypothetical protein
MPVFDYYNLILAEIVVEGVSTDVKVVKRES